MAPRPADHKDVNVARGVLSIRRERTIEKRLFNSFNLLEGLCNQWHSPHRLLDDSTNFREEGILPVEFEILLVAAHFRPKQPLALQTPELLRQVRRIDS